MRASVPIYVRRPSNFLLAQKFFITNLEEESAIVKLPHKGMEEVDRSTPDPKTKKKLRDKI